MDNLSRPAETPRATSASRILDAVLTYGAARYNQGDIAELAGAKANAVSPLRSSGPRNRELLTGTPVRFAPHMGLVLAIGVGAEVVRCALVDANGIAHNPQASDPLRGQLDLTRGDLLSRVRTMVIRVLDAALRDRVVTLPDGTLPVIAAAMTLPTPIDREHNQVGNALRDTTWAKSTIGSLNHALAAALGDPFTHHDAQVMNDCKAAAVAVAFDRVRVAEPPRFNSDDPIRHRSISLAVRVGGGVGMGIIEVAADDKNVLLSRFLKSRVLTGTRMMSGEVGHMPVSKTAVNNLNKRAPKLAGLSKMNHNAKCACGQRHHLEALIGARGLAARLDVGREDVALFDALAPYLNAEPGGRHHQVASQALNDAGLLLGRALTGSVLTLDPETLSVFGALAKPPLLEGVMATRWEWSRAFGGSAVELLTPVGDPDELILRGAGLALIRARRHRRLREIAQAWSNTAPSHLAIGNSYVNELRSSPAPQ